MITALTVNYNTPDYLERLLRTFRKFYSIPVLVIDGSNEENYIKIRGFDKKYDVKIDHFSHNIHHGPGMSYGIEKIKTDRILLIDSDMIIHNGGWLEMMDEELREDSYGIGDIQKEYYLEETSVTIFTSTPIRIRPKVVVSHAGQVKKVQTKVWVDYLHPALALCNRDVLLKYPMPIRGGAPLIEAMKLIHLQEKENLLQRAVWLTEDLWQHTKKYVQHNDTHAGMGTVQRTGSYNL